MQLHQAKITRLEEFLSYVKQSDRYCTKNARFALVKRFAPHRSIASLCRKLGISRSGYYKWLKRQGKPDPRLTLANKIKEIQRIHKFSLGYRRVKLELERQGINVSSRDKG